MKSSETIADIVGRAWKEVLDLETVEEGDFFVLGGNSVMAVALVTQVEEDLGISFPLEALLLDGQLSSVIAECERLVERQTEMGDAVRPPSADQAH